MNQPNPVLVPLLERLEGIRHAFFTREGGVSDGIYASLNGGVGSNDAPDAVRENRRRMADWFGLAPERLLSLYQVHSADVLTLDAPWSGLDRPKADGLVTKTSGLILCAASADCGPILFADGEAGVIGAAHSGWKGAFTGIGEATILAMEQLGAARSRIVAVLGPTIGRDAYEVGPEFVARFAQAGVETDRYFRPSTREGHALFDLPAFIVAKLKAFGVGNVEDTGLCTYADAARFFSYRRATHRGEPDYGRLLSAICLND